MRRSSRATTWLAGVGAIVLAALATAFCVRNGASLGSLVEGIGAIDPAMALLGLAFSGLGMANRGMLNRAAHRAVGLDAGVGEMTHTAAVGFAAQKMVKSAGAVGLAVFVRHGHRRGRAAATVVAACVLAAAASFLALGVLLTGAIGVLAATGRLTGWWIAAAIGFSIYALLVGAFAVVVSRSRRATIWIWRRWRRVRRRLSRRPGADDHDASFPTELFDAIARARRHPDAMRLLLFHAVASKTIGASMLIAAVVAVGLPISVSGAVVIYATALAASMVAIVPGGFGAVEGSIAALLLASGATAGAATLAVALFRLFDLWLPVLTGAVAARGQLRATGPHGPEVPPAPASAPSPTLMPAATAPA